MFLRVMSSSLEASGPLSLIFTVIARWRKLARSEVVVISNIFHTKYSECTCWHIRTVWAVKKPRSQEGWYLKTSRSNLNHSNVMLRTSWTQKDSAFFAWYLKSFSVYKFLFKKVNERSPSLDLYNMNLN